MAKKKFDFKSIQTVEDAFKKQNIDRSAIPAVSMIPERFREALLGVYELFIIFEAINDGWKADFTNPDQIKYFPWQKVNSAGSGFAFAYSNFSYDRTATHVGSRLCTDTPQKASYISKQFGPQYGKFFL
jgi:hypothetical protein